MTKKTLPTTSGLAQWRQEARNNGSANLKLPCAAERVVEAATDAKPPLR